ncbi:Pol [Symbiodinium necroappetens]|uniref:Pol protein n=1 Tax=Symbiodinium necroappetens TaxID=1628268 RepID=A0A812PQ51_9DINO|nr:Pol [Symbiodinium necroappetens]
MFRRLCLQALLCACWRCKALEQSGEHVDLLQRGLMLNKDAGAGALATGSSFGSTLAPLPMTWFHIVQGGSIANMLVHMPGFCPGVPLNVSVGKDDFGGSCYLKHFIEACPGLCDPTHFRCPPSLAECVGSRYPEQKGHLVGMFRQPEQRILSEYYDYKEELFFPGAPLLCNYTQHPHKLDPEEVPPVLEYAELVRGEVVFQLVGDCSPGDHMLGNRWAMRDEWRTQSNAEEAARRVREGFAFVGVMEEWDLSICLFHKMFGGPCRADDFANEHPTPNANKTAEGLYDTAPLQGFHDDLDGIVYQQALQSFRQNLLKYNVSIESCQFCFAEAGRKS